MTTVTFNVSDGKKLSVTATGHAEYADPSTPDIVCAALSHALTTLAQLVEFGYADDVLEDKHIDLTPGNTKIECTLKDGAWEVAHAYHCAEVSVALLASAYPDNVAIKQFDLG